eukprot:4314881-Prymnesium_polylepis.1
MLIREREGVGRGGSRRRGRPSSPRAGRAAASATSAHSRIVVVALHKARNDRLAAALAEPELLPLHESDSALPRCVEGTPLAVALRRAVAGRSPASVR